jgi:hypothetical protein
MHLLLKPRSQAFRRIPSHRRPLRAPSRRDSLLCPMLGRRATERLAIALSPVLYLSRAYPQPSAQAISPALDEPPIPWRRGLALRRGAMSQQPMNNSQRRERRGWPRRYVRLGFVGSGAHVFAKSCSAQARHNRSRPYHAAHPEDKLCSASHPRPSKILGSLNNFTRAGIGRGGASSAL